MLSVFPMLIFRQCNVSLMPTFRPVGRGRPSLRTRTVERSKSIRVELASMSDAPMSPLVFRCPVTNLYMISGVLLADEVHEVMVHRSICIECPLCGQLHDIRIRQARPSANRKTG